MPTGRPMNYNSEDEILEDFLEYKKQVKANPFLVYEFTGKNGILNAKPVEKPLTLEGFFCFVWEKRGFSSRDYFWQNNERYYKFSTIITHIREEIRQDQIAGGMSGLYNSNLTARLNGLKEQVESTGNLNLNVLSNDPLNDGINDSLEENNSPAKKD